MTQLEWIYGIMIIGLAALTAVVWWHSGGAHEEFNAEAQNLQVSPSGPLRCMFWCAKFLFPIGIVVNTVCSIPIFFMSNRFSHSSAIVWLWLVGLVLLALGGFASMISQGIVFWRLAKRWWRTGKGL